MACTECATAFCEEHEPPRGVVLDNKGCTRWEKELQVHCPSRGSTYYCRCSEVCDRFYNTRRTVSVEAAIEEQNQQEQQQQQQEQQEQQQQKLTTPPSFSKEQHTKINFRNRGWEGPFVYLFGVDS